MGIKHFFMWFKNEFSENMYNMRVGEDFSSINLSIDNLMIDMNGVFHNSSKCGTPEAIQRAKTRWQVQQPSRANTPSLSSKT